MASSGSAGLTADLGLRTCTRTASPLHELVIRNCLGLLIFLAVYFEKEVEAWSPE